MRFGTISAARSKNIRLKENEQAVYGDMMTNEKRADVFQIIKEDAKLKLVFLIILKQSR